MAYRSRLRDYHHVQYKIQSLRVCFKKGDIVRQQAEFITEIHFDFPSTAMVLGLSDDEAHLLTTDNVYKLLIGDKIDFYHECYLEFAKDNGQ